jgi:hypothetical protein
MVEWNDGNITHIAKSKDDLLKILLLEIVYNIRQQINSYYKNKIKFNTANLGDLKPYLIELQISIQSAQEQTFEQSWAVIESIDQARNIKSLVKVFYDMDKFLTDKGLMVWATQKKINTDDPEKYMEAQGL